ncbi:MAG TPA: hypothetical protein VMY77_10555 [Chitinophagaceae bacterium]|nr:hypothetical protein [Chitinophagaceae bacterium]
MRISFLCILIIVSLKLYSQSDNDYKWAIKFSPLALTDPLTASIQPGLEYKLNSNWSLQGEYSIPFRVLEFGTGNNYKQNYKYNKWKFEGRWYFTSYRNRHHYRKAFDYKNFYQDRKTSFVALEYFSIDQHYGKKNDHFKDLQTNNDFDYDSAGIRRSVTGFCIKLGKQIFLKKDGRFFIECLFGLGVRYIKINYQDFINSRPGTNYMTKEWNYSVGDSFVGKQSTAHIAINFKVAYKLK